MAEPNLRGLIAEIVLPTNYPPVLLRGLVIELDMLAPTPPPAPVTTSEGSSKKNWVLKYSATFPRMRPVLLTAVTTILGLVPMITGVSFDFHNLSVAWVSESSQWWRSMAVVVVWGLMVATFLTLVVVPSMYFLFERGRERVARLGARLRAQGRDGRT